jgi:Fe-S-cluster containining protein
VALLAGPADLARWRQAGRHDILRAVRLAEAPLAGGELGDGPLVGPCPFLLRCGEGHACGIYEARPQACRQFAPGSAPCAASRTRPGP